MTHPGEILAEEFMKPLGLSARALAKETGVTNVTISDIVTGNRRITAPTAIALAKRFGTTPEFWMNLQVNHELAKAGHVREIPLVGQ